MRTAFFTERNYCFHLLLTASILVLAAPCVQAGPYLDSAHGNPNYGVNRSALDGKFVDYATGNCAHCHEMHASIDGTEPAPVTGPVPHAVFAESFNTSRLQGPYVESDDFCFYCHGEVGQNVTNQDYSATFGGATTGSGPQSIMAAFNQTSYHNLNDIRNHLLTSPEHSPWFTKLGNPCSACHNSHLAKRNWDSSLPGFPLLSAISMPGNHGSLWGENELMSSYFSYEAPFAFVDSREPAGVGLPDGGNTPDYVTFCTRCHTPDAVIASTDLGRELKKIDWGTLGLLRDKHGSFSRDGAHSLREPYATAAVVKSNFVLSCLDCHESHGSSNTMMLRRRINGENVEVPVTASESLGYVCRRCHLDDQAAATGTGLQNGWEYVHHGAAEAPYAKTNCIDCHATSDGSTPIACANCHGHGMDDSWAGLNQTGRKTF